MDIKYNKEARIGLGKDSGNEPLWAGRIRRSQLDRNIEDIVVEPQELSPLQDTLAGLNFENVQIPYLPPQDEMGKRWYASQLIDTYWCDYNDADGTVPNTDYVKPSYQGRLYANNLGNVVFLYLSCILNNLAIADAFEQGQYPSNQ